MLDVQTASAQPHVTRRADYREPDWSVPEIALDFALDPGGDAGAGDMLHVLRQGDHDRPIQLDGGGQVPLSVKVDGAAISAWRIEDDVLVIPLAGSAHVIETEVEIAPERNTQLMGLYASGGNLCTQCEAEGFRRITFFPDRPDILSRYYRADDGGQSALSRVARQWRSGRRWGPW